ncbi:MAG: hypothetical protein IGQ45_08845 [Cyanobacterium sp. T60_A2020_053]|nr:hypothetical protein [Cyanobacterium sp. T60_A2020_053]
MKESETNQQPWWNRPLWGDKTMLEKIEEVIHKPHEQIPPEVVEHHERVMGELRILAPIAKALDNSQFIEPEFVGFIKISQLFALEMGEYKGLRNYVALFWVAIEAKNAFLKLEQIELSYRSTKQQQFYDFLLEELEKHPSSEDFITDLKKKLHEIVPDIKTEEGIMAITTYGTTLESIARQDELGLKLLYLFKKYRVEDLSLLRVMSDMVAYLLRKNLQDFNDVVTLVKANRNGFEQLGKIIELPITQSTDEDYARMIQYIALKQKYQAIYVQFQRLLEVMIQWNRFYQIIKEIRSHYPPSEFDQPPEFQKPIPGEEFYFRYENYLPR